MNCYEHTIIARPDLREQEAKTLINKYEEIINKNSGKVLKTEKWGLKNLSHIIKNNKKGYYFHIKFEGIGKTIEEFYSPFNFVSYMLFPLQAGIIFILILIYYFGYATLLHYWHFY